MVVTPALLGNDAIDSEHNVPPELPAGQQPAASNTEGEHISALEKVPDDPDQQGSPQGHQTPLSPKSDTGGDSSQKSPKYSPPPLPSKGKSMGADKPVEGGAMMQREQVGRTWSKFGIVYPSGGETDDGYEVDYEVGALLLAKVWDATVHT